MTFQDEILARGQSKLKKTLTIETRSEPNLASSSFEQQEPDSRSTPDIHTPRALTFQEEILAKKLASAKNRPAPIVTKPMQPEPETFQSQLQARIKKRAEALGKWPR